MWPLPQGSVTARPSGPWRKITSAEVPAPRSLAITSRARFASTSALVTGSPRPVPACLRGAVSSWWKGCMAAAISSSVMPTPVSCTRNLKSPPSITRRRDDHLAAGIGELDGVGEEVEQDLLEPPPVGDHRRQIGRKRRPEQDALALGERLQAVDASLDQLRQIDRGEVEIELAGIDLGNVEQVVEQAQRIESALMDVLDIAACSADCRWRRGAPRSMSSVKPRIELSGVRTSWLTLARKSSRRATAAASNSSLASSASATA